MSAEEDFFAFKRKHRKFQYLGLIFATVYMFSFLTTHVEFIKITLQILFLIFIVTMLCLNLKFNKLKKLYLDEEDAKENQ